MTNTNTPEHANRLDYVKAEINDYLDYAVKYQGLKITEENYHNLAFKLCAVAAKYALEDQYKPRPKTMLDIIGDLHTSAAIRQYLNITQEELNKLVEDHLILKLTDGKGRNGYPAFQFKDGKIRPDIQKIIKTYLDFNHTYKPNAEHDTPGMWRSTSLLKAYSTAGATSSNTSTNTPKNSTKKPICYLVN